MIEAIQLFLALAVLFSAGGPLCLAQFGHFNAVVAQFRIFNRDRLAALEAADQAEPNRRELLLHRRSWG